MVYICLVSYLHSFLVLGLFVLGLFVCLFVCCWVFFGGNGNFVRYILSNGYTHTNTQMLNVTGYQVNGSLVSLTQTLCTHLAFPAKVVNKNDIALHFFVTLILKISYIKFLQSASTSIVPYVHRSPQNYLPNHTPSRNALTIMTKVIERNICMTE